MEQLRKVIPLIEWFNKILDDDIQSPDSFLRSLITKIVEILESFLSKKFYVVDENLFESNFNPLYKRIIKHLQDAGVISSWNTGWKNADWPSRFKSHSFNLNPIRMPSGKLKYLYGSVGGVSLESENDALAKGVAETLERYSLCVYDHQNIILGSYKQIENRNAVNPLQFQVFSKKQLQNIQTLKNYYYDENSPFSWIKAKSLFDDKSYLVPAQLAYIAFERTDGEPRIREMNTNGSAAGDTSERAAFNAISEAVERDAFMIRWLNKLSPPLIDQDSIENKEIQSLLRLFRRYDIEIYLFDITTDISLPVIMALSIDRSGKGPAIHISTDCEFDIEKALLDVLSGCMKIGGWIMNLMTKSNLERVNKIAPNLQGINDRAIYWSQKNKIKEIEWMLSSKKTREISFDQLRQNKNLSWADKLSKTKDVLEQAGLECYLVDTTSPIARDHGFTIMTSLIPSLYPLYLYENNKYLGIKRLYETPVKMGYFKAPKKEEEMNHLPHPFL